MSVFSEHMDMNDSEDYQQFIVYVTLGWTDTCATTGDIKRLAKILHLAEK